MSGGNALCFYVDDSGSRHPDRKSTDFEGDDWFALGGVLVEEVEHDRANAAVDAFRAAWPQMGDAALHSADIRHRSSGFRWVGKLPPNERDRFYAELTGLMTQLPVTVLACVIDRRGYNERYFERYGRERWRLCKTAFSIAVERAAKFAMYRKQRLRVFVENSDRKTEQALKGYYDELRTTGLPFNAETSSQYGPLKADTLQATLLEFRVKTKQSRLMQIADLALWPVCRGGYDQTNRAYRALADAGKLLDAQCTAENALHGVKYSCFVSEPAPENQKPA